MLPSSVYGFRSTKYNAETSAHRRVKAIIRGLYIFGVKEMPEVMAIVLAMRRPLFMMLKAYWQKLKFSTQASRLCNNLDIPNSVFDN